MVSFLSPGERPALVAKGRSKGWGDLGEKFLSPWGLSVTPEIPTCSQSLSRCWKRGGDATGMSSAGGAAAGTWLPPHPAEGTFGGGFGPNQEDFGPHPSSSWAGLVPLVPVHITELRIPKPGPYILILRAPCSPKALLPHGWRSFIPAPPEHQGLAHRFGG